MEPKIDFVWTSEGKCSVLKKLLLGFKGFDLTVPQFYVTHIVPLEDDSNFKRIRKLHTVML